MTKGVKLEERNMFVSSVEKFIGVSKALIVTLLMFMVDCHEVSGVVINILENIWIFGNMSKFM